MDASLSNTTHVVQIEKSSLVVYLDLEFYINQSINNFEPKKQLGDTCYANACATALHLAMKRILGREGGYPDFHALRNEIIMKFGYNGANTLHVLQTFCHKYRLQCEKVGVDEAIEAINKKRPAVASFSLTKDEWDIFSNFFKNKPTGILTASDLNIRKRPRNATTEGHAVLLTAWNSSYLTLMNSWGKTWGDNGFFKVKNAGVLGLEFIDVYWTLNDLTEEEKEYYREHGSKVNVMKCEQVHVRAKTPDMMLSASFKSLEIRDSR